MAKNTGKKRKLEADQYTTTPKRRKPSNGSTTETPAKTNSEASGSPQVFMDGSKVASSTRKKKKRNNKQPIDSNEPSLAAQQEEPTIAQLPPRETAMQSTPISKPKKPKKRRSHQLVQGKGDADEIAVAQRPVQQTATSSDKAQRAAEKKARRKAAEDGYALTKGDVGTAVTNTNGWGLSPSRAGRFLDHDPIFVEDENSEECLIAATARQVQLLSLESSLLIRTHDASEDRTILCFSRSSNMPHSIDIAYDNGSKVTWNWITSVTTHGTFPGQETAIAMTTATLPGDINETYYIAQSDSMCVIVGERRALYTTQRLLRSIQVLHEGAYIVCRSATAVIVGARKEPVGGSDYVWIELPAQVPLSCVEARLVFKNPTKAKQSKRPGLVLAAGNAKGQIHLYSDLSMMFGSSTNAEVHNPRILHWHRTSVSAIKFSRDGTYLISGGKETVLVLWQLETGRKQFLPHLTAEIERIVVSPEGTKYALQMGDNSIMVLSTSELKPVANFAGLQLPAWTEEMEAMGIVVPRPNTILHPQDAHLMLLSVPSTQPKVPGDVATRPFLQAFDIRNSRHISRQALARNNVTDFNVGPEQIPVIPPDVTQLAVSADGKWLATVDEWVQPAIDLEHVVSGAIAEDIQHVRTQQSRRFEIRFKIWRCDDVQNLWTLSTRADAPHNRTISGDLLAGSRRILRLVSDPVTNSFATIGQDSNVKIWRPRTKTRLGVTMKEADGTDAVDWVCKRTIPLPLPVKVPVRADLPMEEAEGSDTVIRACLAYSPDGSLLACAQVLSVAIPSILVYFVSTRTGQVVSSRAGLIPPEQKVVNMAFLDRYFVTLTPESVRTWDLVEDRHVQTRNLVGDHADQDKPMLAVNHTEGTFAVISYEPVHGSGIPRPRVQVYNPKQPHTLFETHLSARPGAILAGNGVRGYTIVFEDGTIRTLSSATSTAINQTAALPSEESSLALTAMAPNVDDDVEMADDASRQAKPLALAPGDYRNDSAASEDDRPVVRPEQLASIFDASRSFAMPPVRDMFQSVVELFGRKPQGHVSDDRTELVGVGA